MSPISETYGSSGFEKRYEKREKFAWNIYMGWGNEGFISNVVSHATLTHWKYIIMNNGELQEFSEIFKMPWEPIG